MGINKIFNRVAKHPKDLPSGTIMFRDAYKLIGYSYFGNSWIDQNILHNYKSDRLLSNINQTQSSLLDFAYTDYIMTHCTKRCIQTFNRDLARSNKEEGEKYKILSNTPLTSDQIKFDRKKNHEFSKYRLLGSENNLYNYELHSFNKVLAKISDKEEVDFPYIYHILQHKLIQNDLIKLLHRGTLNDKPIFGMLFSRCGHLTKVPCNAWLTGGVEFSFSSASANYTEYNNTISRTIYEGILLVERAAMREYLNSIKEVKDSYISKVGSNAFNSKNSSFKTVTIAPTTTKNWNEDIKMAVNDYFQENGEKPTAIPLRSYIIKKKEENDIYCQHISSFDIANDKVLILHQKPKTFSRFSTLVKQYCDDLQPHSN